MGDTVTPSLLPLPLPQLVQYTIRCYLYRGVMKELLFNTRDLKDKLDICYSNFVRINRSKHIVKFCKNRFCKNVNFVFVELNEENKIMHSPFWYCSGCYRKHKEDSNNVKAN